VEANGAGERPGAYFLIQCFVVFRDSGSTLGRLLAASISWANPLAEELLAHSMLSGSGVQVPLAQGYNGRSILQSHAMIHLPPKSLNARLRVVFAATGASCRSVQSHG